MCHSARSFLDDQLCIHCIFHNGKLLLQQLYHRRKSMVHSSTMQSLDCIQCMSLTQVIPCRTVSISPWLLLFLQAGDFSQDLIRFRTFLHRDKFYRANTSHCIFYQDIGVGKLGDSVCNRVNLLEALFLNRQCPLLTRQTLHR